MPEAYGYAYALTFSGRDDMPEDVIGAVTEWCMKSCQYYAVVTERDSNDRLHLHAGVIFKAAKKPSNVKTCLLYPAVVRQWAAKNNVKHCLKIVRMASEYWLTVYMQKDGPMHVCNFPDDLADCAQAFAHEKEAKKAMNPEFARWARLYHEQERPMPAREEDCFQFFHYNMYVADLLKIMPDQKRLKDRCLCLREYLNKEHAPTDVYHGLQRTQAQKIIHDGQDAEQKLQAKFDKWARDEGLAQYWDKDSA